MNRSNIDFYDAMAPYYERVYGCVDARGAVDQWSLLIDQEGLAKPSGGRRPRLMDLGCGPGWHLSTWREAGFDVVGVDASPAMLRLAGLNQPSGAACDLVCADARDLPARLGTFDLVVAHFCLLNLIPPEDVPLLLASVRRVLAPGAAFIADHRSGSALEPVHERIDGILHTMRPEAPNIAASTWELGPTTITERYWLHSSMLIGTSASTARLSWSAHGWSPDHPLAPWSRPESGTTIVSVFRSDPLSP